MKITIHQPAYYPWLGLMSKIINSDLYVCLDHVQYSKNSFDNRNRIWRNGKVEWITIPVKTKGKFGNNPLNEIEVANYSWRVSHREKLRQAYSKSEYWDTYKPHLIAPIDPPLEEKEKLIQYTLPSIIAISEALGHTLTWKNITLSSAMGIDSKKSQLILDICQRLNADEYISGPAGKDYLDEKAFRKAGIKISYCHFNPEINLSALHYLFTQGAGETMKLIETFTKLE